MITLTFYVPGSPVSKNEGYRINRNSTPPTQYITAKAREWQQAIRAACRRAVAAQEGWPEDPFLIDHVRISIYKYNSGHDHDAGNTFVVDALEFKQLNTKKRREPDEWGLYWNDSCVSLGASPRPLQTGGSPCTQIKVELLGICSPLEAFERRERYRAQTQKRADRRRARAKAKRKKSAA